MDAGETLNDDQKVRLLEKNFREDKGLKTGKHSFSLFNLFSVSQVCFLSKNKVLQKHHMRLFTLSWMLRRLLENRKSEKFM